MSVFGRPARRAALSMFVGLSVVGQLCAARPERLEGAYELQNDALRIVLGNAASGFACLGIENRLVNNARFVHPREGAPGLWKMEFRGPYIRPPEDEPKRDEPRVVLDNRAEALRTARMRRTDQGQVLALSWKDLDLPDEPDVIDVTAEITLLPGGGASEWRIDIANRSKRLGLWEVHYPLLTTLCRKRTAVVVLPCGNWGGQIWRKFGAPINLRYPSQSCPMQFVPFNLGDAGLYLAAHDGDARPKRLIISPEQDVTFMTYAEDMGIPGSDVAAPFPVVVQAYKGDWWEATRIYRRWATQQVWTRKGWLIDREDVPLRFKELGIWLRVLASPESLLEWMSRADRVFPVPVAQHWYYWHVTPADHSFPEYFPAKRDFGKTVRELVGRGHVIMPYINARLWDRDIPSFKVAVKGATKQRNGQPYTEDYGSGRRLAAMCPYTKLWQDKVADIIHRLVHECGVNAVYLDQIGAAWPALCFDPSHGHPVGGGSHWVGGYRKLLDRAKAQAGANNVAFTTENNAEPYMDNIDGFLTWSPRYVHDVPLFPAVYSGYTICFGSPQDSRDDLDAFVMAQGRDLLWGCQPGYNTPGSDGTWLLTREHRAKAEFLSRLCQYRLAAKQFLIYGQLLGEVRPSRPLPTVTGIWHRRKRHAATLPAVMATLWRARDDSLCVFMVNYDRQPRRFAYAINPERWMAKPGSGQGWVVSLLTPRSVAPSEATKPGVIERNEFLSAHEVRAVVIQRSHRTAR